MTQIPLFGETSTRPRRNLAPLASAADPISSHLAAAEVTNSGRRASQKLEILTWLRGQSQAVSSMEIAAAANIDRSVVARRLPDLEHDGLVERGAMRECAVSRRQAITWRASR